MKYNTDSLEERIRIQTEKAKARKYRVSSNENYFFIEVLIGSEWKRLVNDYIYVNLSTFSEYFSKEDAEKVIKEIKTGKEWFLAANVLFAGYTDG